MSTRGNRSASMLHPLPPLLPSLWSVLGAAAMPPLCLFNRPKSPLQPPWVLTLWQPSLLILAILPVRMQVQKQKNRLSCWLLWLNSAKALRTKIALKAQHLQRNKFVQPIIWPWPTLVQALPITKQPCRSTVQKFKALPRPLQQSLAIWKLTRPAKWSTPRPTLPLTKSARRK